MKKIIRIASVIALASASLLYVGCTKDFSADIAKTNQDVAALNQKIETLNSTVQTINSTVENLKTTKADLSVVNALGDKVTTAEGKITTLGGKIDDLDAKLTSTKTDLTAAIATAKQEAIDAASVDAASKLAAAKEELGVVIAGVEDKVDSLNKLTTVQTDSLRKDVDSLYANCVALEERIAALEGRVDALSARITSIVAVPSMNPELQVFHVKDTLGAKQPFKDTAFFKATFAVSPKAAVSSISEKDLKVTIKEGLTRAAGIDTTLRVGKIVADEANGTITVFAGLEIELPDDEIGVEVESNLTYSWWDIFSIWFPPTGVVSEGTATAPKTAAYYSLSFCGKDEAGAEYEKTSEYVKAHDADEDDFITIEDNAIVVSVDEEGAFALIKEDVVAEDTLAFDGSEGTEFEYIFDDFDVAFDINGTLVSKEDFSELAGVAIKAENLYSTTGVRYGRSDSLGIATTEGKSVLTGKNSSRVGNYAKVVLDAVSVNGISVEPEFDIEQYSYIGAITTSFTLPAVSEPWTYNSWKEVSRTVSVTNGEAAEAIHNILGTTTLGEGTTYAIKADNGKGVDIVVEKAKRSVKAENKVDTVVWNKKANIVAGDTVNYAINWKYTLEARPADATIDLGAKDTLARDFNKEVDVPIEAKVEDLTFAKFCEQYSGTIDSAAVKAAIKSALAEIENAEVYTEDGDTLTWGATSKSVTVDARTKEGSYTAVLEAEVYGITYSYTYVINLTWKDNITLHATPYVVEGVAVVDADTTDASGVYTLKNMDMAKYLQVYSADTLAKGFNGYNVVFHYELEDSAKFVNGDEAVVINDVDFDTTALAVNDGILGTRKLNWNGYNGREVEITAYLTIGEDTVDFKTFTLKYRNKPITSFAAGTQTIQRVAGVDSTVVLDKAMVIKGLYNGDKNLIVDTTGAWINGKNYYGCEIAYGIEKATFKVNGEATYFVEGTDYEFTPGTKDHPEYATITFIGDNNNKNIEATIPAVLTYKYDYNHVEAYKDNVVIKVVNE